MAKLSDLSIIQNGKSDMTIDPLKSMEPDHSWCYYFEKADLASQQKNWDQVVEYGEIAFNLADHPNDPIERFPFIEAYAHTGDFNLALDQSRESGQISKLTYPSLCALWERIATTTSHSVELNNSVISINSQFDCSIDVGF
jgi:hypothetical protein